ncbi:hypothetical protein BUALT_Bualt08G0025100 [Buddleja alternifolia]|uniref:Uncharacterized protein n=1 Tax=Buddleja alternifolia TaxID=168488 RepID=A0AAV6X3H2_9LAMI|nr:hypothetical protein BUALT_Bualt08G0025100 [Buddleja alternifolia]
MASTSDPHGSMEAEIEKLQKCLILDEEEDGGVVLSDNAWNSDNFDHTLILDFPRQYDDDFVKSDLIHPYEPWLRAVSGRIIGDSISASICPTFITRCERGAAMPLHETNRKDMTAIEASDENLSFVGPIIPYVMDMDQNRKGVHSDPMSFPILILCMGVITSPMEDSVELVGIIRRNKALWENQLLNSAETVAFASSYLDSFINAIPQRLISPPESVVALMCADVIVRKLSTGWKLIGVLLIVEQQRFNAAKCKTLLKLTIPRIKLLRNRREIQLKQMRREIAKLIGTGQEATARIRVEHIIREEKMMAAQEIVELFCELIAVRLPIIEAQRECPLDLKEAISSVCFAAPRCADLPELLQVQMLFAGKYGKEFVAAASELMPECGVNRQLVELLSIRAPAPDVKLKLLKEIAEEHELDWDPSASESELLKPHEDLLNGPTQFGSGSKVPLPEKKHDQTTYNYSDTPSTHQHSDSDVEFDTLNFPEVPKQPLQSNKDNISAPEMLPFPASALSDVDDQEEQNPFGGNDNPSHLEPEVMVREKSSTAGPPEDKQFVPFISAPSFPMREHNSPSSTSTTKNDNLDLSDVLAAAKAAAETAEQAAAAARSAANIAQLRINEIVKKRNDQVSGSTVENPFHLDKQKSFGGYESSPSENDGHVGAVDSILQSDRVLGEGTSDHQPRRLPSMDDEADFSYPNLFTCQGSNVSNHAESSTDTK